MHRYRKLRLSCLGCIVAFAPLVSAAPAQAALTTTMTTTQVLSGAFLDAGGAGAAVQVSTRCATNYTAIVALVVRQHISSTEVATHYGQSSSFLCTGAAQTITVGIGSNGPLLRTGHASVTPTTEVCSVDGCVLRSDAAQGVTIGSTSLVRPSATVGAFGATTSGMAISIASAGTVSVDGTSISVPVTYRCTNWFDVIEVQFLQRNIGGQTVTDTVALDVDTSCTNARETFVLSLTYAASRYHAGTAFVLIRTSACANICGVPSAVPFRTVSLAVS